MHGKAKTTQNYYCLAAAKIFEWDLSYGLINWPDKRRSTVKYLQTC